MIDAGARRQTVEVRSGGSYMSTTTCARTLALARDEGGSAHHPVAKRQSETVDSLSVVVSMWRAREGRATRGVVRPSR